ncbi:MAG TPA: tetratricopeptide repeat protein [Desulfobacteraceae bacterium]|nr:tetratricopeptide repeat protein [Desulfobacteraceae bacterium]
MWETFRQWFANPGAGAILLALVFGVAVGGGAAILLARFKFKEEGARALLRRGDRAFLNGIHYILSNDHDHAIEEFTKSVKINSDTIETYVALGNLYRSKGDIDRAIRIRRSIILRPGLDEKISLGALYDLGMDYRAGGFLNRALATFQKVLQRKPSDLKTLEMVERICEEVGDWDEAYRTRQRIAKITGKDFSHILAHQLVESGKIHQRSGDASKARGLYEKALSVDEKCIDAYLHLGDLHADEGDLKKAVGTWRKIVHVATHFSYLAYGRLERAYHVIDDTEPIEAFLKEVSDSHCDAFSCLALAKYRYASGDLEGALAEVSHALEYAPGFWAARKLKGEILLEKSGGEEVVQDYAELIEKLDIPYGKFQCSSCGFTTMGLLWQCPQCRSWDTISFVGNSKGESHGTLESDVVLPRLADRMGTEKRHG